MKIKSLTPPILVHCPNQTYVMPGWIPVDNDFDLSTVKWEKESYTNNEKKYEIKGSKGGTYIVTYNKKNGMTRCTCPGAKFRGTCKHIKEVMNKY
jgi:hypothetical protein